MAGIRTFPRTPKWTRLALCLAGSLPASQMHQDAFAEVWSWSPVLPRACSAFGCAAGSWGVVTVGGTYWKSPGSGGTPVKWWMRDAFLLAPGVKRWERLPDYPTEVGQLFTVGVGDRIYTIGGRDAERALADVYWISTVDFSAGWERGPALPHPSYALGGGVHGKAIYAVTDEVAMQPSGPPLRPSSVLALNTARDDATWSEISTTPAADVGYYTVALAGGNLFLFGGAKQNHDDTLALSNAVWAFNLDSGTWSARRPLPYPLRDASAVALNDRIVLIAGGVEDAADSTPTPDGRPRILLSNRCLIYDAQTDEFTFVASLRLAVADHGLVVHDGLILAVAGEDSPYRTRTDLMQSASIAELLRSSGAHCLHRQQSRTYARTAADNFQADGILSGNSTSAQASQSFIKKGVQP